MNFYALATNKEGKAFRVTSTEPLRHRAEKEIGQYAKENGLKVEGVYQVKNVVKQPQPITKNIKKQKENGTYGKLSF